MFHSLVLSSPLSDWLLPFNPSNKICLQFQGWQKKDISLLCCGKPPSSRCIHLVVICMVALIKFIIDFRHTKGTLKVSTFYFFFLMLHFHYNYNFPPLLYQRQPRLLLPILLNPISRYVGRFSNQIFVQYIFQGGSKICCIRYDPLLKEPSFLV